MCTYIFLLHPPPLFSFLKFFHSIHLLSTHAVKSNATVWFPTVRLSLRGTGRMFVVPNQTVFHSNTHTAEESLNEASITAFFSG